MLHGQSAPQHKRIRQQSAAKRPAQKKAEKLTTHLSFPHVWSVPEEARGLQRPGDSITLRLTAEQTDGKYSVAEFATPGGVGQPPHTHAWDETYLVLEGELNLNINGQPTVVGTGGWYQVKAGVVHAPTPNGDFCRYVMVGQPGGVESVFKSLKANQKDLSDMGKVVEIVTKEGVNIAG